MAHTTSHDNHITATAAPVPGMSDEEFERDADAVGQDLAALKSSVETD